MNLPQARTTDLVVQDLGTELLVYDLLTNQAYNLNETSKIVFNACNGKIPFDELKRKHRFTDDLIYYALDELKKSNLIESEVTNHFGSLSRREVIRKVGLASMVALPIISVLIAPHAAQAASQTFAAGSRNLNQSCNTSTDCNSSAPSCVTVRGQSSTGKACCMNGTSQPVFLTGGDPNGGGTVNYTSQASCESAVSPQCCSRTAICTCTSNGNGSVSCSSVCQ